MHVSTTGKIVFSGDVDQLDLAAEYLDGEQFGETFFDDDTKTLVLAIEDDLDLDNSDQIVEFISRLYDDLNQEVNIHMIGVMTNIDAQCSCKFECQRNGNYLRYREAEWSRDWQVDEDLSYEEFEEANDVDVDEEEYGEYIHRAHEGIKDDRGEIYGEWEYFD